MLIKNGQLPPGLTPTRYNNILGHVTSNESTQNKNGPDEKSEVKISESVQSHRSNTAACAPDGYEEQMQKYEAQIRNHISVICN